MKTITLTLNETLVLIAEGMTMNNVKSLANKLRNADAPVAAISTEKYDLEKAKAQSKTWEQSYHDAMVNLEKAKQTESTLRQQIKEWENAYEINDESLKYFRKWVEELRTVLGCDKGMTTVGIMSDAIEHIKEHNKTVESLNKVTRHLVKANDVIAAVKLAYDERDYAEITVESIKNNVEAYYRGN